MRSSNLTIVKRKDGREFQETCPCYEDREDRLSPRPFREDIEAALDCVADVAARAEAEGASLLCFPEGFLQGYLTDETPARRNALDLTLPAFKAVLNRFPKTGAMMVMGLIEAKEGRLFNTAIVVNHGALIGYRKVHLLRSEQIFDAGSDSHVFEIFEYASELTFAATRTFPRRRGR